MNSNGVGERLHDRATRGEVLTAEEQAQLNEWYAERDRAEAAMLCAAHSGGDDKRSRSRVRWHHVTAVGAVMGWTPS